MTASLSDVPHLIRRFFGHVTARPLSPREQADVVAHLGEGSLATLFFRQDQPDQRHALDVATAYALDRPGDDAGYRAALLHDVGKHHCGLGPIARSLATVFMRLSLPMPSRWHLYQQHGPLGATDLESAGADALTVAFARYHPAEGPPEIPQDVWNALLKADHR